jgi:VWFA-related protein
MLSSCVVRRAAFVVVVLLAATLRLASQTPPADARPQPQSPVFRGGTNLVQVDAIVTGDSGEPVLDLTAADFEVSDDGRPVTIDRVRFLGAIPYGGDQTLAPIRTRDDEEREASRDDVRVYAILLDDYHVQRMRELGIIEPLLAFVRQLPPTDLVGVHYPLDSVTDVNFTRNREPVYKAIRPFYGRRGDYTPRRPVENDHLRFPNQIELIRRQITVSALEGLAVHLGGIKQGRKAIVFVTEGFVEQASELQLVFQAASRANVAIYPVDPRGLTEQERSTTAEQMFRGVMAERDGLRMLARETGGRAVVGRNDLRAALDQIVRDSTAYYLMAYESPHPDDGKFHRIRVRIKRSRATVFARPGYWAFKRGQNGEQTVSAVPALSPALQAAVNQLAESLRPDADEPAEARRSVLPPAPRMPALAMLVGVPIVAVARGRAASEPARRREFRRTDTLVVRAITAQHAQVTARLLDRFGRPLTELPSASGDDRCELTLALGSLGPGDYVIELSGRAGDEAAQQFVAFRVVR